MMHCVVCTPGMPPLKHPGTPRSEHVCPGFMETAEEQHEQFCKVIDQGLLCPRVLCDMCTEEEE